MSNSSQSDWGDYNRRLSPSLSPDTIRRHQQPMEQNPVYSPDAKPFELLIEGYNNEFGYGVMVLNVKNTHRQRK
ncbi:unnamed protein product [Macrosiphum euphorbiae]|uniref:Uncharacterized protein n=1 Tax=Macrosiphum euphorbiae TaxID=13131 RepID=A0AAV0VLY7_9HEMI|nr:unnamed protein product [Macrosiphum euphorbiae]CAI6369430.1 unnamed protein product [Macrosiphum euphorbiae]CAI6377058.1 unnamed protein product [Macrosiphum euphorbiae]